MMRSRPMIIGFVLFVVACGTGGESDVGDDPGSPDDATAGVESVDEGDPGAAASGVSEDATAVLTIDGGTFTFEATDQSKCELSSQPEDVFAYFGDGDQIEAEAGMADFDFVLFNIVIDKVFIRGRAGGEERTHTAGTDDMSLDMRSDGFSYSYDNGEGVRLDVTC